MSGHAATGPVEGSQAVLERIQVTVLPSTKSVPMNPTPTSGLEMEEEPQVVREFKILKICSLHSHMLIARFALQYMSTLHFIALSILM